jgi:hypothetical protein
VAVGDTITWQGAFGSHPLSSTTIPGGATSWSNGTGSTFSYVVTIPGDYNYMCNLHGVCCSMVGSFSATPVSVNDNSSQATSWNLEQNFPNPFNPTTTIRFTLPASQFVTLRVFDIVGNEVATLVDGRKSSGSHVVEFDGAGLASGIYFCRLEAGQFVETKKLVLMK